MAGDAVLECDLARYVNINIVLAAACVKARKLGHPGVVVWFADFYDHRLFNESIDSTAKREMTDWYNESCTGRVTDYEADGFVERLRPATQREVDYAREVGTLEPDDKNVVVYAYGESVVGVCDAVNAVLNRKKPCSGCGASDTRRRCGGCLCARYCSERCHTEDWRNHKPYCQWVKARIAHLQF